MAALEQDINQIMISSFKSLNELHQNPVIQKYFDTPTNNLTGIEHIFKGKLQSSNIIGCHSEILFPNLYGQDTISSNLTLDKTGPYELKLPNGKRTSCFPLAMTPTDVIIAILKAYQEALKNPPLNKNCSNWKRSYRLPDYGFNIQVVIKQGQKIFDGFPLIPID